MTSELKSICGPVVLAQEEDDSRLRHVLELCKETGVAPVIVIGGIFVNGSNNNVAGRDLAVAGSCTAGRDITLNVI